MGYDALKRMLSWQDTSGDSVQTAYDGEGQQVRHVAVTHRRTPQDYAEQLQWRADVRYPQCQRIRLIQDNMNTHTRTSWHRRYPAEEARRLAQRFEIHATPKHGSWLDLVEIEIGIVERGC